MSRRRAGLSFRRQRRKFNLPLFKEIVSWVVELIVVIGLAYVLVSFFGIRTNVVGQAMEQTLENDDNILVNRFAYIMSKPKSGDVIVFLPNGNNKSHYYVRRVVAVPGDTVQIKDGALYVNDELYKESTDVASMEDAGLASDPIELEKDEYFVLGDNRNNSEDSRYANMNFQWYPGHMTKAKRQMQEDIKLIDLVIELVDARIPLSSRNPDIDELGKNKYRLILMNKADLADKERTREWSAFFKEKGFFVVSLDARSKSGMKSITDIVMEACKEKIERDRKRGIKNRPVRAMVVGIPNVGKSTFINSYAGKACAKTGNKPGVTKGKQWIRLNKSVELLDTPGILWPKFEDQTVGLRLALIGSIKDEILNVDELAVELVKFLKAEYPGLLAQRYEVSEENDIIELISAVAVNRKCLSKGGEPDYSKAAALIIDDFRSGKLGHITLERPKI